MKIELQLGNIDRCRKLYENYLEWSLENCYALSKYDDLESSLSENDQTYAMKYKNNNMMMNRRNFAFNVPKLSNNQFLAFLFSY